MRFESAGAFLNRIIIEGRNEDFQTRWSELKKERARSDPKASSHERGKNAYHEARLEFQPLDGEETYSRKEQLEPQDETEYDPNEEFEITANCDEVTSLRWVIESLGKIKGSVHRKDAPSNTAWALYEWADKTEANKNDFINRNWNKLIPQNKALENAARMQDDGRKIEDLLDRISNEAKG